MHERTLGLQMASYRPRVLRMAVEIPPRDLHLRRFGRKLCCEDLRRGGRGVRVHHDPRGRPEEAAVHVRHIVQLHVVVS